MAKLRRVRGRVELRRVGVAGGEVGRERQTNGFFVLRGLGALFAGGPAARTFRIRDRVLP